MSQYTIEIANGTDGDPDIVTVVEVGTAVSSVNGYVDNVVLDTDDVSEGATNQYYTDTRANSAFDTRLATKDTDDLSEGATNLYYTEARARDAVSASGDLAYNSTTGDFSVTTYKSTDFDSDLQGKTTDDLDEGTNLYYTDSRVDANVAAKSTDDITEGVNNLYYTTARFDNAFDGKSTSDLTEGVNLYYTDGRANSAFDTRLATKDTDDLAEGVNNKYYTDARVDANFTTKDTDDLAEGVNLYYTDARVDANIATKTTDDLSEGTNLYYTDARANSAIDTRVDKAFVDLLNVDSDTLDGNDSPYYLDYTNFTNTPFIPATTDDITEATNLYYTEARVDANIATKTTDDLSEGTNLYYTDARAQAAITGGTGVDVTAGTVSIGQGVDPTDNVTFNDVIVDGDLTVNGTTTSVNSNEVDIGDNIILLNSNETGAPTQDAGISIERGTSANVQLVWDETSDRWTVGTEDFVAANFIGDVTGQVSDISNHSTTNLTEGTNLYYTDTRVNADIDGRVDKAFVDALNVDSDTLDNQQGTYYLDYNNFTNTPSIPATTNDISEGTNLYFTDERVDDRVNNLVQGGSGITVTYDDAAGTLTIESLVSGYGSADFVSDFASKTTADLTEGTNLYYTNERVDDRVANLLVGGNNITVTYDDAAGTLTVDGQPGYTTSDFSTDFANKTTTDLTEGSKLYYTQGRFDSAFGVKTTSNLTEGSNLYYTTARANSAVDSRVTKTFVDNLNVDAATLGGNPASAFATSTQGNLADTALQDTDIGTTVQGYTTVLDNTTASYTTAQATKLSGIQAGATTDQTKSDIDALNVDAGTLDGINGSQFLRNDQSGTINGDFTVSGGTGPAVFTVVADSDNSNESDTAEIRLSQDGGVVTGTWH